MLQDSFIETSVKRKTGFTEVFFNTFLVTACILTVFFVNFIPFSLGYNAWFITGIISFGIVAGVVIIIKRESKIYEIEMSNDLVDCAVIHSDNKRDDLMSFSIKDCEYIGPVTSDRFESDKNNSNLVIKMTEFKNFDIDDKYWYFLITNEGYKIMIVFHYKEEMYPVFRRYNPRGTIPMAMPHKAKAKDTENE
jgi:hypothetical protein